MLNNSHKMKDFSHVKLVFEVEEAPLVGKDGNLNRKRIDQISMLLSDISNSGRKIILVTAGALVAGKEKLRLDRPPSTLPEKQAIAAIGQVELIKIYQTAFDQYNQKVAQVLLARNILENQNRLKNAKNTFNRLLEMDIIPIINENDTVSTEDIIYENNYPLTASVANIVSAGMLILFDNGNKFRIYPAAADFYWYTEHVEGLLDKIKLYDNYSLPGQTSLYPIDINKREGKRKIDI